MCVLKINLKSEQPLQNNEQIREKFCQKYSLSTTAAYKRGVAK
jgi:hypothetical protein